MFTRLRRHLSYANVMATIALFVALGGTGYAALTITGKNVKNDSLTSADLKNNRGVKSIDVTDGSLLSKDFRVDQLPAGPQGPKGDPGPQGGQGVQGPKGDQGEPATRLFARVTNVGALQYGRGATGASWSATQGGYYTVTFNQDLTNCVGVASPGLGHPSVSDAGKSDVPSYVDVNATSVSVKFWDDGLAAGTQTGFHLAVFC